MLIKEMGQQIARLKKDLAIKDTQLEEKRTELVVHLRVMEKAVHREMDITIKLKNAERIASERERTIDKQSKTIEEQTRLISQLSEKNKLLAEVKRCKICLDEEIQVLFIPCGHLNSCKKCACKIHQCPLCRDEFKKFVPAFFS